MESLGALNKTASGTFANTSRRAVLADSLRRKWMDAAIVCVLIVGAGLASLQAASYLDPVIFDRATWNTWFESDLPRVYENMTMHWGNHSRTKVHPLFSLISYTPVYTLRKMFGMEPVSAVRAVTALMASLWIGALFILLRLVGCRRFDAVLFTLMGAVSAAAMFWFAVPESYSFGSLSILVALIVVALAKYRVLPVWLYTITSASTLSITVTNWMVGIFATFANYPWKRALQVSVNAFCIVVLLWGVQKFLFRSAVFFIGDREEARYMFTPESGGIPYVATSFLFHTMVMPDIKVVYNDNQPGLPIMATQLSLPGSGSMWGIIAVALWAGLVALGVWALVTLKEHRQLRIVLGVTLLGQFGLHALYGPETFLYALHFGPLLVVLAALSAQTRARPIALTLAIALVICAGINNVRQFGKATELFSQLAVNSEAVSSER
jgi:hypothetical protein